jgi:hypothetical protein
MLYFAVVWIQANSRIQARLDTFQLAFYMSYSPNESFRSQVAEEVVYVQI